MSVPTKVSSDLERLRDDGYNLAVVAGLLVVSGILFVDRNRAICNGTIVVPLELAGNRTVRPSRHDVMWGGGEPCNRFGEPLSNVVAHASRRDLGSGVIVTHALCNRPHGREFYDYHELVTTYVALIEPHAVHINPSATAMKKRDAITPTSEDAAFHYMDTASARSRIGSLSRCFAGSVAIVGVGGTGSYVLDLIAKTPVASIHLFDDDIFLQHNAFRSPGAASIDEIGSARAKVDHFAAIYSRMHRSIIPHKTRLNQSNLNLIDYANFVFLCLDDGAAKRPIIDHLERTNKSFIDVGLGVATSGNGLFGTVRVTTSTPDARYHVHDKQRIPFVAGGQPDAYASNIQIADLNALNASLAVIRWKRLIGFYLDGSGERHSTFDIDGNHLNNADHLQDCQ